MSEWISVMDRLPDKPGRYLVVKCTLAGNALCIDIVQFTDRLSKLPEFEYRNKYYPDENYDRPGWWNGDSEGDWEEIVTHWMPLPELPKEDSDG